MSAMSHSVSHTQPGKMKSPQSEANVCVLSENGGHCLFLSPLKRPFPAPATDKPFCVFVFVLG